MKDVTRTINNGTTDGTRFVVVLLIPLVVAALSGCGGDGSGGFRKAAAAVGLTDSPPLPAEIVDIGCDVSSEAPCTMTTLAETVSNGLLYAAARPGTHVRLWRIGRDISDTSIVAEQVSPGGRGQGKKAVKADRDRFVESARRLFLKAAEPMLDGPRVNRSPLLEAVTKIALAEIPGLSTRVMILITDGLEYSRWANWETGDIDPIESLSQRLHAGHVLTPGVLKDTRVFLSFCDVSHVSRSPSRSTIARLTGIQDAWRTLVREAGATTDVTFTTGVAPLGESAAATKGQP